MDFSTPRVMVSRGGESMVRTSTWELSLRPAAVSIAVRGGAGPCETLPAIGDPPDTWIGYFYGTHRS
jgi:hypothetical protein